MLHYYSTHFRTFKYCTSNNQYLSELCSWKT